MKEKINKIFDNLDKWRHFPSYQLERRADIFFSLYLHGIMEKYLGEKLEDIIVPEFPIKNKKTNRTWKIDYILISKDKDKDKKHVYFVELKTDMKSINEAQKERMLNNQGNSFCCDLKNLTTVIMASRYRKKYFHLLHQLCELGLYENSEAVKKLLETEDFKPSQDMPCPSEKKEVMKIQIVCIQPEQEPEKKLISEFKYIYFDFIIKYLNGDEFKSDTLAKRFIESLKGWKNIRAGSAPYKTYN